MKEYLGWTRALSSKLHVGGAVHAGVVKKGGGVLWAEH